MMKRCGLTVVIALVAGSSLVSVGGLAGQDRGPATLDPQPSVELPAELARVLRDYERHWSVGEAAELAELFVDEGLVVSGGRWIRGRDAIERAYQIASGPLRLRAIEYGTDGDVGFIVGAYGYGEALPVVDRGLFTLALRRGPSGRWLIVSDLDRGAG